MSFIDTTYFPFQTNQGKLTIAMNNGLPVLTSDPEIIVANLSTISAVTVQGELPQNNLFGVPARNKIDVLNTNLDESRAAKAAIIQKIAQDTAGSIDDNAGLNEFTQNVEMNTFVEGGPSND